MTTVVQIAGTSGAGKTWLVQRLLEQGDVRDLRGGDGELLGHALALPGVSRPVHVVGPYLGTARTTFGCDTIKDVRLAYARVAAAAARGEPVLFEGIRMMNQTQGPAMARELGGGITVVLLTTPLAVCCQSIDDRRAERGADRLDNSEHTRGNWVRARNYSARMRDAGARVRRVSREEALYCVLDVFQGTG